LFIEIFTLSDKNFKNLNEDEQKEMLGKIFSKMDKDGDENIVQAEMVDWAWQIERKYMAAEIKNWLNWYDIGKSELTSCEWPKCSRPQTYIGFRREWTS